MKATEALTLEACLIAIAKLETELPPDLHQSMQAIGQALQASDPTAVSQLRDLVTHHADLQKHYDIARELLQEQYHTQERAKAWNPQHNGNSGTATLRLEAFAIPMLTADDFRTTAQRLFQRDDVRRAYQHPQSDLRAFLHTLKQTVTTLDPVALELMRELERKPATVENLSYGLNLALSQAQGLAQRLQKDGYIGPLNGNFLHMMLPLIGVYPQKTHPLRADTYLSLTAKGYFQLNPVIEFHRAAA